MRWLFLFLFLICTADLAAQFQSGFDFLENQEYKKARQFFEQKIDEGFNSKTVHICLARAIGLGGHPLEANRAFLGLIDNYPNDVEVTINLAESFLWMDKPNEALGHYQKLLATGNHSFAVLFGMANALSESGNKSEALQYIEKAEEMMPDNKSPKISKKYILLGLAVTERQNTNYQMALDHLSKILSFFPTDEDALIAMGECYILMDKWRKASGVFKKALKYNGETYKVLSSNSYINILLQNHNKANHFASKGLLYSKALDTTAYMKSVLLKIDALGAGKKFNKAFRLIDQLESEYCKNTKTQLARARLNTWNGTLSLSENIYDTLQNKSFESYLGRAELYTAMYKIDRAEKSLEECRLLYPNRRETEILRSRLKEYRKKSIVISHQMNGDNNGNSSYGTQIHYHMPFKNQHKFRFSIDNSEYNRSFVDQRMKRIGFNIFDLWKPSHKFQMSFSAGMNSFSNIDQSNDYFLNWSLGAQYKLSSNHNISGGVNRYIESHAYDMLSEGLISNDYFFNYSFVPNNLPKVSLMVSKTFLSDKNSRQQVFSSLYYDLNNLPLIRAGFNISYLKYAIDKQDSYFSPDNFLSLEAFIQISNEYVPNSKFDYRLNMAYGQQRFSKKSQDVKRIDLSIGYKISNNFKIGYSFLYSNVVTQGLSDYGFHSHGVNLNYRFK